MLNCESKIILSSQNIKNSQETHGKSNCVNAIVCKYTNYMKTTAFLWITNSGIKWNEPWCLASKSLTRVFIRNPIRFRITFITVMRLFDYLWKLPSRHVTALDWLRMRLKERGKEDFHIRLGNSPGIMLKWMRMFMTIMMLCLILDVKLSTRMWIACTRVGVYLIKLYL